MSGDKAKFTYAYEALKWHFGDLSSDEIVTSSRSFPIRMRPDVQLSIEKLFAHDPIRFFGTDPERRHAAITVSSLMRASQHAIALAPPSYEDVDIGEDEAIRCLENGLWLRRDPAGPRYAVLLSYFADYHDRGAVRVEIAVPIGERGDALVRHCFRELELAVANARSYRGKVLSLELANRYSGEAGSILVHRLPAVRADEVILPDKTLRLLDRNVLEFAARRRELRALGMSAKKGVLLYGPPGTGKTHTIRYLASSLKGHTTLLMTAEQVGLLPDYFNLARLLQPSILVIEDVDLIARDRESMGGPCEEVALNALLNEMDGLKEDSDTFFILTTNRPEKLEAALASRPGRIDQAIEVPLPDDIGRTKLVRLYGRDLKLEDTVVAEAVSRTKGVSAAFIKELMRRTAQASIERGADGKVASADIQAALEDMLFTGGRLNLRLLGGEAAQLDDSE